nr:MAG TPA: hypothetical protein [Caudoviricetes sp.]
MLFKQNFFGYCCFITRYINNAKRIIKFIIHS